MADRENPPRRAIDPVVEGLRDGVSYGYQAIDRVSMGLRESLRIQGRAGPTRATASGRQAVSLPGADARGAGSVGRASPTLGLIEHLTAISAELLGRASGAVQDVANSVLEQTTQEPATRPDGIARLQVACKQGDEEAAVQFDLWNTGTSPLRDVTVEATELVRLQDDKTRLSAEFTPPEVKLLHPGKSKTLTAKVSLPKNAPAGKYRGLIQAEPGDACVLLELTVTAPTS